MKTNSDAAIGLITLLLRPPGGLPAMTIASLKQLGGIIKVMDAENFKLRQEVQMLRAVLEQERDKVC